MPNTNPQAILIANEKLRPLADRLGQVYNYCKMAQDEYAAEGWLALFPNDAELIEDGSATDGRTRLTNQDVRNFMTYVGRLINIFEGGQVAADAGGPMKNNVLKVAVHPEPR
jgi:hypothetical protein